MRVLVWAATLGALVGSTHAGGAAASPLHPSLFAEQISDRTFELVAERNSVSPAEWESVLDSWIDAAFFSNADYETLSSMTGFHDGAVPSEAFVASADARSLASTEVAAEHVLADLGFEWDSTDVLPSPAVLAEMAFLESRLLSDEDYSAEPALTGNFELRGSADADATEMALDGYEDR